VAVFHFYLESDVLEALAPPILNKQSLRDLAFAQRLAIPPDEQEMAALAVRDNFLKSVYLPIGASVSAYMPIKGEMSALPLLDVLMERGYMLLMPRVVPNHPVLEFRTWNRKTPMIRSIYGIEEPDPAHSAVHIPDVFILPLLAFDKQGNRLGYGAGYYDQTFAQLRGKVPFKAVGIAYETQLCDRVPHEGHDHRLDMCITEKNVYTFGGSER
jgi:5-formyltetrahydrofolate cyclo-ligase